MPKLTDYHTKFEAFKEQSLFAELEPDEQRFVRQLAFEHRFTFQEWRQVVEACRDLAMWRESSLRAWWQAQQNGGAHRALTKQQFLRQLQSHIAEIKKKAKTYPASGLPKPRVREKKTLSTERSQKKIHGMCPVASEETVCCNLRTIDAVENCAFGCSYCTIQTFYADEFVFDADFAAKLQAIAIEPDRFYHYGTGQSSDSLVWGNRNGNLDALCAFAAEHPNVLLEFKTKSDNISYFLQNTAPPNIVCSWSLNTPTIVSNEEHFTASLEQRLAAARAVADRGIKVSFHFHPIVYYDRWQTDYPDIAKTVMSLFQPEEVLFISFGSVTMIKPAIKKIRRNGHASKILQMEMVPDPHGKLTYPDDLKVEMFRTQYAAFASWHDAVFFYLCMEKAAIWQRTFGFVYDNNETFEHDFLKSCMQKIALLEPKV